MKQVNYINGAALNCLMSQRYLQPRNMPNELWLFQKFLEGILFV